MHNFIQVSDVMPKFRKITDTTPRKHQDRWKDGRTEGWTE